MIFLTDLSTTHTEQISAMSQVFWPPPNSGYPEIETMVLIKTPREYLPIERRACPVKDSERRENNTQQGKRVEN
jgi:hypothetical protein